MHAHLWITLCLRTFALVFALSYEKHLPIFVWMYYGYLLSIDLFVFFLSWLFFNHDFRDKIVQVECGNSYMARMPIKSIWLIFKILSGNNTSFIMNKGLYYICKDCQFNSSCCIFASHLFLFHICASDLAIYFFTCVLIKNFGTRISVVNELSFMNRISWNLVHRS